MENTKRKRWKANREINPSNDNENLFDTSTGDPIIHKESERKRQRIFEKVDLY